MSFKTSLYSFLSGSAGITALTTSISPQNKPPSDTSDPFLVFSLDDDADGQVLDGISGMKEARVVIDCYSTSYVTADSLATAVKAAMAAGAFGSHTAGHIRKERELDLFEADTRLHRVNLQFLVAYS